MNRVENKEKKSPPWIIELFLRKVVTVFVRPVGTSFCLLTLHVSCQVTRPADMYAEKTDYLELPLSSGEKNFCRLYHAFIGILDVFPVIFITT